MQKKTDRRVRKTKSQLKTGLAQLMREKSIREITVKELVDAVDINRSTFYLHYCDIPGLLAEAENEMMEEMQRAIREHPIDPGKDTVYYFIQDLFHVLDENRQIASALVGPHGDIGFVHKLEQLLEEKSRESLAALVPEKTGEMKYFYSYCLNGCLGFVKTWLETGEKETPEYAAEMAYRMVVSSVTAFYDTKEGREDNSRNETREIWLTSGIYPDLSGMCHWLGKCLAFSVYYRKVWRSSICSDLSAVSCSVGIANHGDGIRSGSWKSGKYCTIL